MNNKKAIAFIYNKGTTFFTYNNLSFVNVQKRNIPI